MPRFVQRFGFESHPFENYVAENEPQIQDYAVTPPYFEETSKRAHSVSSYILFGYRGAGKSATRITTERSIWSESKAGEKVPLIVNLTDFEPIISGVKLEEVNANRIISHVAFLAIESMLLWISDQAEGENFDELLNDDELKEFVKQVKAHYLTVPEFNRKLSVKKTMQLLHQTWINQSVYWIEKRWEPISALVAKVASKAGQRHADLDPTAIELHEILKKSPDYAVGLAVLQDLVICAQSLGFSGLCVFVDKVDETSKTSSSSDAAAKLVYPVLSQVQLMEVRGFAWIFFLWDRVRLSQDQDSGIRLDKLPFGEISWDDEFLLEMVKNRLKHFSEGRVVDGSELCARAVNFEATILGFIAIVGRSPRELMRILDVLVREYDVKYASEASAPLLSMEDFEDAINSYVRNVLWNIYDRRYLSQILRLNMQRFTNKDVQEKFKVSDQSARNWIRNWVSCGAVRQSGTTAGDNDQAGKPANVYVVSDRRVAIMMERELYDADSLIVEVPIDDADDKQGL